MVAAQGVSSLIQKMGTDKGISYCYTEQIK